jgi:hypothetical protein
MNRRQHTLIAWLLPLLCLRALLPAGFMPVLTESGWQVVLCSGSAYQSNTAQPPAGQSAAKASQTDHTRSPHVSDGACLFAVSAASAPIPFVPPMELANPVDQSLIRITREQLLARPLIRAQQSRAPPSLS